MTAVPSSGIPPENTRSAAELFVKYGSYIERIIHCSVQDRHLRNDIYQEFFIAVSQKPFPDGIDNMKGYLYRAVRNFAGNSLRKIERYQKHIYQHNLEAIRRSNQPSKNGPLSNYFEPMKIFELAVSKLAAYQSNVIILKHQKELKNAEIAKRLNIGKTTVNAYYSSGLRRLREIIRESGEF